MRISFGSIADLRSECLKRDIHDVRRGYMVETKVAESNNEHIGKVGITTFKLIVTATDGRDLLRLERRFYSCLSMMVNEEATKKEVQERTEQIEEQLHKDFPAEYHDETHDLYKFVLSKGVIESIG